MQKKLSSQVRFLVSTSLALGALAPLQALAQEGDSGGGLEEIIVTAQKREQSVQDVPIAVTAVTQETLQANRISTVNDLGSIAPGVTVRPSAGGISVPSFTIRGQNSFGVVAGSDKQVSIYLDGVYISSPRGSIFDLPDIERLEVLRGPQGTLFGRNATAGAVSVTTRDPTGEAHVKAQASIGNYDSYRVRLSADLPQIGPFSAYFSFMRNYKRGDIRNAAAGTVWDRTASPDKYVAKVTRAAKYLGTINSNSYFGAVKFEPSDSLKMVYKFDRNEDAGTPEGSSFMGYNPAFPALGAGAALVGPVLTALYNSNGILTNPSLESPKVVSNAWSIPRAQRVYGHSLTSTWLASDNISVKNIASYRFSRVFAPVPIDGISTLTFTPQALVPYATLIAFSSIGKHPAITDVASAAAAIPGIIGANSANWLGKRFILTGSQASSISKQWSDEMQVNYSSEKLQLTVGALWFHSSDQAGGPEGSQNTFSFASPFMPASGAVPMGNEGRYYNKATSMAAYAQAEYKITPQLEMVLGARITHDKKTSLFRWDTTTVSPAFPALGQIPAIPASTTTIVRPNIVPPAYKKSKPNFLVGLNWKPNDDTLVYGKFSTSFVSGGSVAGITFKPETATSWELGLKADMLDRRLRTNLALFWVDYKNFQQPSSTTSVEAVDFLNAAYGTALGSALAPNLSTFVQQAHDVRAKGFELEVTAAPVTGLTAGGSISYTDTQFRNINPLFLAAQGGQYSSFSRPKWTGSVFAAYETAPLAGNMTLSLRADGLYRSKFVYAGNYQQQLSRGVPERLLSSPAHWKFNARAALRHIEVGGLEGELAVWGRNLTNKRHGTSMMLLPWGNAATFDTGKTYGLDFGIEF